MQLQGKTAIVTGASSGIGHATALALAKAGAKVAIVARREENLEVLADAIKAAGGQAVSIRADLVKPQEPELVIAKANRELGRIDILVNNAGVMYLAPVIEAVVKDWRYMVELNLLAVMYTTHAVIPLMKTQGGGHIVNISSVAGRTARATAAAYNATKWGVVGFTEGIRQEVYKDNIRTTLIEPGAVATELAGNITHPDTRAQTEQFVEGMHALTSEDIAAAILYAVTQPPHVDVNEILIRPTEQER